MNAFWRGVLESQAYQDNAVQRVIEGKAPHIENYWVQKLNGRPIEKHEHSGEIRMPVVIDELHRE